MTLEPDYSLSEVAEALKMSERWIRNRVNDPDDPAEHLRYGHKIRFTAAQVEALRARHSKGGRSTSEPMTTGKKRGGR